MLRTTVIGVGHLGRQHARIHAAIAAEGGSQFVSVCDIDDQRSREAGAEWQVQSTTDWQSLIGKVDAASVAVPTESHCAIACALLEAGIHVLVEKPISRTLFWRVTTAGLNQRAVRDGDWKLLLEGSARVMLFDVSTDLGERNDMAASNTVVVRRMHQQLLAWEKDVDAEAKSGSSAGGAR